MRCDDRQEFRKKFRYFKYLGLFSKEPNYYSHRSTLEAFITNLKKMKSINRNYFGAMTGKLLQYFASQMVKSVHRLHEKGFGHMQVWSKNFVIRKSFEVHLMPSGFEAALDDPSNEIIWEEAQSKKFK